MRQDNFNCAQGRLLKLGLQPKHEGKNQHDLAVFCPAGYENPVNKALLPRSDGHPSTIGVFVTAKKLNSNESESRMLTQPWANSKNFEL
jgi:hypothetical protein